MAQVCGITYPFGLSASFVVWLLEGARVRVKRRKLGVATVKRARRELLDADLVWENSRHEFTTYSSRCLEFTLAAQQRGDLQRVFDQFQGLLGDYRSKDGFMEQARLRWLVASGQWQLVDELQDRLNVEQSANWRFLAHPPGVSLLEGIPQGFRDFALIGALAETIDNLLPPEALLDACQELSSDLAWHVAELAFARILQGRLEEAVALFDKLPEASLESKGRVLSLRRLRESPEQADCLTEQDRAAVDAAEWHDDHWEGSHYRAGWGSLHALAGHPHLYQGGKPVEVVQKEPELVARSSPCSMKTPDRAS